MGCGAAWGPSSIQDGSHRLSRHLGSYLKFEIIKERRKLKMCHASHVEYDTIKHLPFAACTPFLGKKVKTYIFIQK